MITVTETAVLYTTEKNKVELSELVDKIHACARDAAESSHEALSSAIAAGGHLTKAKGRVLYGKWSLWLKENFEFSQSTANGWMRLHENRHTLIELIKDMPKQYMSVADALKLISPPVEPPSKLAMVRKRCRDVIREIYSQKPHEAKQSKDDLVEHIKEISNYLKKYT